MFISDAVTSMLIPQLSRIQWSIYSLISSCLKVYYQPERESSKLSRPRLNFSTHS